MKKEIQKLLLSVIFAVLSVPCLIGLVGYLHALLFASKCHRCEMPVMSPSYKLIPWSKTAFFPYRTFQYGSLTDNPSKTSNVVVIYLHGNSGSFKQVRTLGSWLQKTTKPFREGNGSVWTVDFGEEFVVLEGARLQRQIDYVRWLIQEAILNFKDTKNDAEFILVGHSMGAWVARRVQEKDPVKLIILLSMPHSLFPIDLTLHRLTKNQSFSREIVLESSWNDWMAPPSSSLQNNTSNNVKSLSCLPLCWSDPDHQASIWSHCVIRHVALEILSTLDLTEPRDGTILSAIKYLSEVSNSDDVVKQVAVDGPFVLTNLRYEKDFILDAQHLITSIPGSTLSVKIHNYGSQYTPLLTLIHAPQGCKMGLLHDNGRTFIPEEESGMGSDDEGLIRSQPAMIRSVQKETVLLRPFWIMPTVYNVLNQRNSIIEVGCSYSIDEIILTEEQEVFVYYQANHKPEFKLSLFKTLVRFLQARRLELTYLCLITGLISHANTTIQAIFAVYAISRNGPQTPLTLSFALLFARYVWLPLFTILFVIGPLVASLANAWRHYNLLKHYEVSIPWTCFLGIFALTANCKIQTQSKPFATVICLMFWEQLWVVPYAIIGDTFIQHILRLKTK